MPSFTPRLLKDINPMGAASSPSNFTGVGSLSFFTADDGTHGVELWKSDGTTVGTQMVLDINSRLRFNGVTYGSYPENLTNIRGTLFFRADDGTHGSELWRSDGTAAGTFMVLDNVGSSYPENLTDVAGTLFYNSNDGTHGRELWESNGIAAGTMMVKDINPGNSSSDPNYLTNVNGTLFFRANDGADGVELWRSDGTAAGTQLVQDINPLSANSNPSNLMNISGKLFFLANDGTHGVELWTSNGTAAGTQMVLDINPSTVPDQSGSYPKYLTNVNGTLFFSANDGSHGRELWESNVAAGTRLVLDINPPTRFSDSSSYPKYLTNVNGTLFFQADDGTHGVELWKSNGAAAGTDLVLDINPGLAKSNPKYLTNLAGTLFFWADDGTHGAELWRSNGAGDGTQLVKDIRPGAGTSYPAYLTNVNGTLFFPAYDGLHGLELWESNGATAGTNLAADIFPGAAGSHPMQITPILGSLLFSADDGTHGREPWLLPVSTSTSSTVQSSANPSVYGQALTLVANVQAQALGAGIPTGTVVFKDAGSVLASGTIGANGRATISVTSLAIGKHTITAVYGGDNSFAGSTSASLNQMVAQDATVTLVGSSPNPSSFDQAVTLTATVSAKAPGAGIPAGTVAFKEGSAVLAASVALSGGRALYVTAALDVGTHTISAVYSGSTNFTGSQGNDSAHAQVVQQDAATASIRADVNPSVYGQRVTFTATVASSGPAPGPPTGSVIFKDGNTLLGMATLDSSGRGTMSTASLTGGSHAISAIYGGDHHFSPDTSIAYGETVHKDGASVTINSSPNPSVYGQTVALIAHVTSKGPGAGPPTGSVIFKEGGRLLGKSPLDRTGSATFRTNLLTAGSHTLTAVYSGDTNFGTSQGTGTAAPQVVKKDGTTTAVGGSPNPSVFGHAVTFTATVRAAAPGSLAPAGSVIFDDGTKQLGIGSLNGAGQATFSTASLSIGNHSITARYPGDINFTGSTAPHFGQVVHAAVPAALQPPPTAPPNQALDLAAVDLSLSPVQPDTTALSAPVGSAPLDFVGGTPHSPLGATPVDRFFATPGRGWNIGLPKVKPRGLPTGEEWIDSTFRHNLAAR